jgi:hypothetical protein
MNNADKVFNSMLSELNPRQKEVIMGRFGLENASSEPQTLAALGEKYGVTRERIRQIEAGALALVRKSVGESKEFGAILAKSSKMLASAGGVMKEASFLLEVNKIYPGLTKNQISLLLEVSKSFNHYEEDKDFWSFYYSDKSKFDEVNKNIAQFVKFLRPQKEAILAGQYNDFLKKFTLTQKINEVSFRNYLAVSKKTQSNVYGDIGLSEWSEIRPQNIRDRIYLILRKKGEPLHFETITNLINEKKFDHKIALVPTVHNELIKDNRFVLVGRGMYALSEHGYEPGTVQEVIKKILKTSGPMKPKDISAVIEKQRILKPNTILVNLQNRKFFERLEDGRYKIREA